MLEDRVFSAVKNTKAALEKRHRAHWIFAFSGGKDSTAALKVCLRAYRDATAKPKRMTLIYCDTGVENPVLDLYVKELLDRMSVELRDTAIPLEIRCLKAPVEDRFFVRLIGRGYPPPTNSFRWCTTGLRIRPVSRFIQGNDPNDTVVVLGLRQSESQQRDRSLAKSGDRYWQKQREGAGDYDLFLPIVDMDVPEVCDAVFALPIPSSINPRKLEVLYRDASGECPVIKAPNAPPCASGRFGCWTCTVVRKDKSAIQLIDSGYKKLEPFLKFRDWLSDIRNDPEKRWPERRNGSPGMGPFTIDARREILDRVNLLEAETRTNILDSDERGLIASLWNFDQTPRLAFPKRGP